MKSLNDKFNFVEGKFQLIEKDKNGIEKILVYDNNLVVNNAFTILAGLMSNPLPSKKIDTIKLGTGGILNSIIQTPQKRDTQLYRETFSKQGFTDIIINTVDELSITFMMILGKDEANNLGASIFNEAGLFSGNGIMFARKTFSEQLKTVENEWTIKWTIIFK